jgi:N-acetylmuramoyl-L-alanine amidase
MRKIHTLIWHTSATREGQHVTVDEIRDWHVLGNGWSDIGYHKVVYLDGSVHDGRPMTRVGAHVKNHNTGTLGYCYIGGVQRDGKTPKDTRTAAQIKTMARLTREAVRLYGIKRVAGHNEYAAKACPSFDVRTDPSLQRAFKDAKGTYVPQRSKPAAPAPQERANIWSMLKKLFRRFFGGTGAQSDTGGSPSMSSSPRQPSLSSQRLRLRQVSRLRRNTSR